MGTPSGERRWVEVGHLRPQARSRYNEEVARLVKAAERDAEEAREQRLGELASAVQFALGIRVREGRDGTGDVCFRDSGVLVEWEGETPVADIDGLRFAAHGWNSVKVRRTCKSCGATFFDGPIQNLAGLGGYLEKGLTVERCNACPEPEPPVLAPDGAVEYYVDDELIGRIVGPSPAQRDTIRAALVDLLAHDEGVERLVGAIAAETAHRILANHGLR